MPAAIQEQLNFQTLDVRREEEATYRDNYNRRPFVLRHKLAGHPLLQLSHLTRVAQSLAQTHPDHLYYNVGNLGIGHGWDSTSERPFSASEAIQRIESADAWMILRRVQILPEYGELLDSILGEIHELSGRDLDHQTMDRNISIIVTSPKRITPYHMDADCNYLLQLDGRKTAYVFDGADRSVVTATELERFYLGDVNAAQYREASQAGAWRFEMTPGMGIHVPVTFPHWVENADNVSISASLNFRFTDRTVPDIYRVNHYLRKLGFNPDRVGDGAKKLAIKTLRAAAWRNRR